MAAETLKPKAKPNRGSETLTPQEAVQRLKDALRTLANDDDPERFRAMLKHLGRDGRRT